MKENRPALPNSMFQSISTRKERIFIILLIPISKIIQLSNNWPRTCPKELRSLLIFNHFSSKKCLNLLERLMFKWILKLDIERCGNKSSWDTMKSLKFGPKHLLIRNWSRKPQRLQSNWQAISNGVMKTSMILSNTAKRRDKPMDNLP